MEWVTVWEANTVSKRSGLSRFLDTVELGKERNVFNLERVPETFLVPESFSEFAELKGMKLLLNDAKLLFDVVL